MTNALPACAISPGIRYCLVRVFPSECQPLGVGKLGQVHQDLGCRDKFSDTQHDRRSNAWKPQLELHQKRPPGLGVKHGAMEAMELWGF